MKKEMTLGY